MDFQKKIFRDQIIFKIFGIFNKLAFFIKFHLDKTKTTNIIDDTPTTNNPNVEKPKNANIETSIDRRVFYFEPFLVWN